jgi:hypothetical protein
MTNAFRLIVAVTALALLAPVAAQATSKTSTETTVVLIEEGVFTPDGCLEFPLLSAAGAPLGDGRGCITGGDFSCFPVPYAGCRQTTYSTFEFNLPDGSVSAPMTLRELFLSESSLVQVGSGPIGGGTGVYSDASGRIAGGGLLRLTDEGFEGRAIYVVRAR